MNDLIALKMTATNSSGEQNLWLVHDGGEYWFQLLGEYNGQAIQLDFDILKREQLVEMRLVIELILES